MSTFRRPTCCVCAADSYMWHAGFMWDFAAALPIIPQVGRTQQLQPKWTQQRGPGHAAASTSF